jgi:hypothetical protein
MSKAKYSDGSIDTLRNLLAYKVTINGTKMNAIVNPATNQKTGNMFMLFYNGDNESLHMGNVTQVGYYRTGIQIAARHDNYALARKMAYSAMSYLSTNKTAMDGVFISIVNQSPVYSGIDETGNHIWVADINLMSQE